MNDTPQGDGNSCRNFALAPTQHSHNKNERYSARRRKHICIIMSKLFSLSALIRMNDTPQGDGN